MMANGQTWELQRCHPRIFTDFRFRSINNFQQNRFISDIIWNSINGTLFLTKFWFTKCISGGEWRKKCFTSHFFPGYLLPRNQIWTSSLNSGFFNTFFDFLFSFWNIFHFSISLKSISYREKRQNRRVLLLISTSSTG